MGKGSFEIDEVQLRLEISMSFKHRINVVYLLYQKFFFFKGLGGRDIGVIGPQWYMFQIVSLPGFDICVKGPVKR